MKCECPYTLKVPLGNAFQVLFPVKTAEWKDGERTVEVADVRALTDIVVKVDGEEWQDWEMDERGPLVNFPKDSLAKGPHNVEVTADYFGVAIRAAYFECITMVQWSYESNIGNYIIGSPLVAEAAYIYVGITDDEELEALKQQYREATAACETARLEYEAAKEEFDEKAEQLDDVATQEAINTLKTALQGDNAQATLTAILAAFGNIDFSTLAKQGDNPAATNSAILEAMSHISPEDPYSQALAQFFNLPQALPDYHAMTTAEVLEIANDVWDAMYGFVTVPNTLHTVNAGGQQVDIATYFNPSRTYGSYGFPELWAQNDQQQWVSILTDHPTAGRDIYTYNPSNNE